MGTDLQTKLEKYEEKATKCQEAALKLSEGAQRTMYEVLAEYYVSLATDFRHAIETCHQPYKCARNFEHDPRAARRHQRRIAAELNAIAEALLTVDQDSLAGKIFRTQPQRAGKAARRVRTLLPAVFVLLPAP